MKAKTKDKAIKTERRISSGGVVFRRSNEAVEVALIEVESSKGKVWSLPKGLVEEGENLARTAHREVKEETGLDGKILKMIDHIQYFFTMREDGGLRRFFKIVYFFLMEHIGGDVFMHDREVAECRWFTIDRAIRLMKYEDEKEILKKSKRLIKELKYI